MKMITQEWLNRASDDVETMKSLLTREDLTNIVAFHAQQAVEKSLKALIEEYEIGFIRTHDVERLYELLVPYHLVIEDSNLFERLNTVYIESRYPGDIGLLPYGKPTLDDARILYNFAMTVHDVVCAMLAAQRQIASADRTE